MAPTGPNPRRTLAQRAGDAAEAQVADHLVARGWVVLGRQVRAGRSELDLVAIDPGPERFLVVVEVRWRRRRDFGLPEETLDHRKLTRLRVGLGRLWAPAASPTGRPCRTSRSDSTSSSWSRPRGMAVRRGSAIIARSVDRGVAGTAGRRRGAA